MRTIDPNEALRNLRDDDTSTQKVTLTRKQLTAKIYESIRTGSPDAGREARRIAHEVFERTVEPVDRFDPGTYLIVEVTYDAHIARMYVKDEKGWKLNGLPTTWRDALADIRSSRRNGTVTIWTVEHMIEVEL